MHPMTLAFVSLLAASHAPSKPGHKVEVRSLVQGSGTVIMFDDARDMQRAANGGAK